MQAAFADITALFTQYTKSGTDGERGQGGTGGTGGTGGSRGTEGGGGGLVTSGAETLQQAQLVTLATDTGLVGEESFPLARLLELYALVVLPVSITAAGTGRSGRRSVTRNALKLHSFMELLVLIAFFRANPAVSITPATAAGVGEGAGAGAGEGVGEGEEALEAPLQQVEAPLPGCLQMMLAKHVLKAAKRNPNPDPNPDPNPNPNPYPNPNPSPNPSPNPNQGGQAQRAAPHAPPDGE